MEEFPTGTLYQGVSVDIRFGDPQPAFGDLFRLCGFDHPRFPPTGEFGFDRLTDLQFEQVDDCYGVRALTGEGTDVPIWLYPLVDGEPVYHHQGPYDGVRLEFSVLRNPVRRAEHFLRCVQKFAAMGNGIAYRNRGIALGNPPDLEQLRADIATVVRYWADQGIAVGSDEALAVEF